MQWRRPGGAVVQVYWTEHPQDGALEWSSTGPPSSAAATTLRVSSSELSHCVYVLYFGQLLCCAALLFDGYPLCALPGIGDCCHGWL